MRFYSTISLLSASVAAVAVADTTKSTNVAKDISVNFRAIGVGVTSRKKSTEWYTKTLGITKIMEMALGPSPITPWDEDILSFAKYDKRGSQVWSNSSFRVFANHPKLVIMEWKEKKARSVKDLPFKLQFSVPDPAKIQAAMGAHGGQILTLKTEGNPEALYAKDLDGYLIELVKSNGSASYLSSATIATSNLQKKLEFWSQTTQMKTGEIQKSKEWDTATVVGDWGAKLEFAKFHQQEEADRTTDNLPYKIVISVSDAKKYIEKIKSNNGKVVTPMEVLGGIVGFVQDPNDSSFIEINTGAFGGPP
jgi:predicted enzyme related to lactoylglutathione lyase